jgi:UPF0176 protein
VADVVVAALYHFASLPDYRDKQLPLKEQCTALGIRGTLLLAEEGINGTISGSREGIDGILAFIRRDPRLNALDHKESFTDSHPFRRMKVKLKKEIVTLGVEGVDPNRLVGTYVEPEDWNALISDPDVVVIDTRNDYEVALGTFQHAVDPKTHSFREFRSLCASIMIRLGIARWPCSVPGVSAARRRPVSCWVKAIPRCFISRAAS